MFAGQALLDPVAIVGNMELRPCSQRLGSGDACVVVVPHQFRGEIGVSAGPIPVAPHWLGVKGGADVELLAYPI